MAERHARECFNPNHEKRSFPGLNWLCLAGIFSRRIPMSAQMLIERHLPMHWSRLPSGRTAPQIQSNQLAFAMLDAMEEPAQGRPDAEPHGEMARIEAKLNLILHLLGQLLHSNVSLPATHSIRFASDSVAWPCAEIQAGERVLLELYLDSAVPVPIVLHGEVAAVLDGWARIDLTSLSEDHRASWSRWVFRQHRRDVAKNRQQSGI